MIRLDLVAADGTLSLACCGCDELITVTRGQQTYACPQCGAMYEISWHPADGSYQGVSLAGSDGHWGGAL
jgi:hypothetical protein